MLTQPKRLTRSSLTRASSRLRCLQLLVDGRELLVGRLHLLLGRLQLLVGALQLLVAGEDLLVGRLELLVPGLVLLDDRLQIVASDVELATELDDLPASLRLIKRADLDLGVRRHGLGQRRFGLVRTRPGLEENQEVTRPARGQAQRPNLDLDRQIAAVSRDPHGSAANRLVAVAGKVHRRTQIGHQAFPGHLQKVKAGEPGAGAR